MTVVERMGRDSGRRDEFPVGMRVLAVDDDPTCLKLLETLLLRCQYHVTTTNQAIIALKMLRENKDQFDLVISDVHMPDMDGFKLLELVGLEMDLPVIMLSGNGETQTVMKGITHGACDYLLKPVRIEELKNIWQHVIRRKKVDTRDHNNSDGGEDCDKAQLGNSEGGQGSFGSGASEQNGKLNRKRKDQNEEEDDEGEEMHENDDPSAQKKPRVVWSVELHRKFVAAVNQLGLDKAVPKRILDLMNVERLTRENVASHLQKYRLYLKRLSAVASQQANMVAALRGRDSSYLPLGSLDGYPNFNTLVGSRQLPTRTPLQSNGMVPRLNSPAGFGLHGVMTPGNVQFGHTYNSTNNPPNDLGKLQAVTLPALQGNQHGTLLQGMPTSLELDRLQQPKVMQEASNRLLGGFSSNRMAVGSSTNSFTNVTNSPLLIQPKQQHIHSSGLGNQSSLKMQSLSSDPFEIALEDSSPFADLGRCNDTWQGAIPSTKYSSNMVSTGAPFRQNDISPSSIEGSVSSMVSHIGNNARDVSCGSVGMMPVLDSMSRNDAQARSSLLGGETMSMTTSVNVDSHFLNFASSDNSKLKWNEQRPDHIHNTSLMHRAALPNFHMNDHIAGNHTMNHGVSNAKLDMRTIDQTSFRAPFLAQKIDRSTADGLMNYRDDSILEDMKLEGAFDSNGCNLDELVNAMIKPERDDIAFMDGDMGCSDIYSLGTCM